MIYGRFGDQVEVVRLAILEDIQRLDRRKPDKRDRDALAAGSYVIVRYVDDQKEALYHLAYLRATDGIAEIDAALARATSNNNDQ